MNKKTLYGADSRAKILAGVQKIAAAVKVTLGPSGRNVVIAQSAVVDYGVHNLPLHISKDGYTVTRCFDLDDPFEKVGVLMVKEAAQKTVDEAGDATTTTVILTEAIVEQGIKLINEGANPMEIKKGIDKAVEYVVSKLKEMAVQVGDDNEKLFHVATVSANNDPVIGRLISDAFKKIGNYGIIDIEESKSADTEIKIADGYKLDKGWFTSSPLFINNREKQVCEFENPLILFYQNRINHHTQFEKALGMVMQMGKPLVIICEAAVDEGLAVLVRNNFEGRVRVCVVNSPFYGEARREAMEDMAVVTGGKYISDSKGVGIKDIDVSYFGTASKVIVSKEETVIIGGKSKGDSLTKLLAELKANLEAEKDEAVKAEIEKRIARLTGGVAVIQVGATTETEMKEKIDRVDDAVRATKAAIAEGYVAGGGTAFIKVAKKINFTNSKHLIDSYNTTGHINYHNSDYIMGQEILCKSLTDPILQICVNCGVESEEILTKVSRETNINIGYNARTNQVEDLVQSGIIDPVKVLRCALQNAASSAGMILTAECCIVDTL